MEFQKLSSPSLRELFVEQLEHMILSGKLKMGEIYAYARYALSFSKSAQIEIAP